MLKKNKIAIFAIIVFGLVIWAVGYIPRYPIWVDDFSCLGDDVFSRIIINGRFERPNPSLGRGTGYSMLDLVKIRKMSDSIFIGQGKEVVRNTFNVYGCGCQIVNEADGEERLICKVKRQWRLKNIGKDIDENPIFTPSIVMSYDFEVDKSGMIRELAVNIINVTPSAVLSEDSIIIK
jgi:hypothetical protein